ncbi:MAG TPA: hypothetical protein VFH87_05415 [Candidatus Udaeobacter sp.]|nr:hypothetical protein [Candidatus Udaeobacter sp.]
MSDENRGIDFESPIANLQRYFIAADKMRICFDNTVARPDIAKRLEELDSMDEKSGAALLLALYMHDCGVFQFYWWSVLYVVIEGYEELKLHDEKIDALLQSPHVDALKRLRHATFHFQNQFFSRKMYPFLAAKDSVSWIGFAH